MRITKKILDQVDHQLVTVPSEAYFELPEKVLQFGTGVLLRGLPDYFIDKANKQQLFNGRVVVVKSTSTTGADAFKEQDGIYTHCVRGIEKGQSVDEYHLNASISRVLTAATQWEQILELAASSTMQLVISNTTESGLVLDRTDLIHSAIPKSFPGKLLAFLYRRWNIFNGAAEAGMVILPTELIPENGKILLNIINELALINQLELAFIDWLHTSNYFCNTLVDRIVPGKLSKDLSILAFQQIGYEDDLMIMSEPFRLWAIETDDQQVKDRLAFASSDEGVVITHSIQKFRDLKLRLLNGTHSFSCAIALLAGYTTVKEAMNQPAFVQYLHHLMQDEISTCLISKEIDLNTAHAFAESVKERFANPSIEHKWASIAVNYTEKMRMRNVSLIEKYASMHDDVPEMMALGFAAYLQLMHDPHLVEGGFTLDDPKAIFFKTYSQGQPKEDYVHKVLSNKELWGVDLSTIKGFELKIISLLNRMDAVGMKYFLAGYFKTAVI